MLPKVSFLSGVNDENYNETGSFMVSRYGRITSKNYPVFSQADPISIHERFLANLDR